MTTDQSSTSDTPENIPPDHGIASQKLQPRRIRLTAHFMLGEFVKPEDDMPAPWILDNLVQLANRLQVLRDLLGKPIRIQSGYRTPERNRRVGGSPKSLHLSGMAADITVDGMSPGQVQAYLANWSGGLGSYPYHTHVDIRPGRARWRG